MTKSEVLTVNGNKYPISFPNVGQMMDIEAFKMLYTKNKYIQLSMSNLKAHTFLLDMADAISYLSILIPKLQKDLDIKDWWELDPHEAKKLVVVYKEQFLPWYLPYLKELYKFDAKEDKDETDKSGN